MKLACRAAVVALAVALVGLTACPQASATTMPTDYFMGQPTNVPWAEGSVHGNWVDQWNGYGTTQVINWGYANALDEHPATATSPGDTHSALVTSAVTFSPNITWSLSLETDQQLRTPAPNPWEVAWALWDFTTSAGSSQFYALVLKTNGWEIDKITAAGQQFLATGSSPTFPINNWYWVQIQQSGGTITVSGALSASVTDPAPLTGGHLGLYTEDSVANFTQIAANG